MADLKMVDTVSAILRVAIQFECRLKLMTVSEMQLMHIRSNLSFLKQVINGFYFYELLILSDVALSHLVVDLCWTFVWKLALLGMYAIRVKNVLILL